MEMAMGLPRVTDEDVRNRTGQRAMQSQAWEDPIVIIRMETTTIMALVTAIRPTEPDIHEQLPNRTSTTAAESIL